MATLKKIGLAAILLGLVALYGLYDETGGVVAMDMGHGAAPLRQAAR